MHRPSRNSKIIYNTSTNTSGSSEIDFKISSSNPGTVSPSRAHLLESKILPVSKTRFENLFKKMSVRYMSSRETVLLEFDELPVNLLNTVHKKASKNKINNNYTK